MHFFSLRVTTAVAAQVDSAPLRPPRCFSPAASLSFAPPAKCARPKKLVVQLQSESGLRHSRSVPDRRYDNGSHDALKFVSN